MERQKEAEITIIKKEDPLINIKKQSEQIVAIKLQPVDPHMVGALITPLILFPESIFHNRNQYLNDFGNSYPLAWNWNVSQCKLSNNQILNNINNTNYLLDTNTKKIYHNQAPDKGLAILAHRGSVMLYNFRMKTGVKMSAVPASTTAIPFPVVFASNDVVFISNTNQLCKYKLLSSQTRIINGITDWIPVVFVSIV